MLTTKKIKTMIHKKDFGKHKDVLFVQFGTGDILITKGSEGTNGLQTMIMLSQDVDKEIGTETDEYNGKDTDTLGNVAVVLEFLKTESITTLIHSLVELQQNQFKFYKQTKTISEYFDGSR